MAYRFDGTDDEAVFAIAPLVGYTFDALTWAIFLKRNTLSTSQYINRFASSGGSDLAYLWFHSGNTFRINSGSGAIGPSEADSTNWLLLVVTKASGSTTPRFHVHNGTSWSHVAPTGGSTSASITALTGTDTLRVSYTSSIPLAADVVCVGLKKADSSDATVETLSRTLFSAWQSFGFDWLIGFDTSLTSGGALQDQASPGTGDETSKVGTSVVSDPAGWTWAAAAPAFVPKITIIG